VARIENFEDLEVWQEARRLSKVVRGLTQREPFAKDFRFSSQINAAAGSIMDNVAEGFERDGNKEFINFLFIAKGSNGEVRSQSYRAFDSKFISKEELEDLLKRTELLKRKIFNLITTLRNSGSKGYK
jgi:four helix bundle protein